MKASKKSCMFIAIMYVFALQCGIMRKLYIFQFWDELYAVLCIPLMLVHFNGKFSLEKENKYIQNIIVALGLFLLLGIVSNCIYKYQNLRAVLQDIFLNLKFFMGIITTYYLFKNFKLNKYKSQIRFHAKFLIIVYFFLVMQNKITHIFPVADMRFGICAEKIFFNHPTELASATFFLLLILMLSYNNTKSDIMCVGLASVIILLTLRFKAIATVLLYIYLYFIVMSGKKVKALHLVPFIPFAFIVGGKEFYFYFLSSNSMDMARGALSYTSLKIAMNFFPLGTGFGTFASWMSGVYYSPIYQLYGISGVYGLTQEWPQLVSDVYWPMIIAQNGFIGLVLYIFSVYCLFRIIIKCSKIDKRLFLAGMGALSYLLISSIAESAFVNPLALPLAFVIGLCICIYKQRERGSIE